jgi:hypothetical protein
MGGLLWLSFMGVQWVTAINIHFLHHWIDNTCARIIIKAY